MRVVRYGLRLMNQGWITLKHLRLSPCTVHGVLPTPCAYPDVTSQLSASPAFSSSASFSPCPDVTLDASRDRFKRRSSCRDLRPFSTEAFRRGLGTSGHRRQSHDLYRFLAEVGTDPREARYWLKYFQRQADSSRPFAIVLIEQEVFAHPVVLDSLCSSLAFLQRSGMSTVLVHGMMRQEISHSPEERQLLSARCTMLVSLLESHGASARPLYAGSNVLQATADFELENINTALIQWCMQTGHMPVVPAIAETSQGHVTPVSSTRVMSDLAVRLQPMKVLIANVFGGIKDKEGKVVANMHLPRDLDLLETRPWFTPELRARADKIYGLLQRLNEHSAVIITAASALLHELFTHHGSGTFFKITEPIETHGSLDTVDHERLLSLLKTGFGRELKSDYMKHLKQRVDAVLVSQSYSAAAVVARQSVPVPYLDKFVVDTRTQGLGTSGMLWAALRSRYPRLFWRSRCGNKINPWYFRHADGSYSNGTWIVFWYGVEDHSQSSALIDLALTLEESFTGSGIGSMYSQYDELLEDDGLL